MDVRQSQWRQDVDFARSNEPCMYVAYFTCELARKCKYMQSYIYGECRDNEQFYCELSMEYLQTLIYGQRK